MLAGEGGVVVILVVAIGLIYKVVVPQNKPYPPKPMDFYHMYQVFYLNEKIPDFLAFKAKKAKSADVCSSENNMSDSLTSEEE